MIWLALLCHIHTRKHQVLSSDRHLVVKKNCLFAWKLESLRKKTHLNAQWFWLHLHWEVVWVKEPGLCSKLWILKGELYHQQHSHCQGFEGQAQHGEAEAVPLETYKRSRSISSFTKLQIHISTNTNYLRKNILQGIFRQGDEKFGGNSGKQCSSCFEL